MTDGRFFVLAGWLMMLLMLFMSQMAASDLVKGLCAGTGIGLMVVGLIRAKRCGRADEAR